MVTFILNTARFSSAKAFGLSVMQPGISYTDLQVPLTTDAVVAGIAAGDIIFTDSTSLSEFTSNPVVAGAIANNDAIMGTTQTQTGVMQNASVIDDGRVPGE